MKYFKLLLICLGLILILPSKVMCSNTEDAHVTLMETFGLGTKKEEGKYRVVTFIPRTFLLFDINYKEPDLLVGKEYLAATTQDGVRLFILERAVSRGPFKTVFGEQDIIFNKSHYICLTIQCDPDDDDQLLKINAGEVFQTEVSKLDDTLVYKLIGNRGNRNSIDKITGYINKKTLDELNHKSVITFVTLKHPRYKLVTIETNNINTECGGVIKKDDLPRTIKNITEAEKKVITAFNLASIGNQNLVRFKKSYG